MSDRFSVRPVRHYQAPRFPAVSRLDPSETPDTGGSTARKTAALAMTALTLLFLNSCYREPSPPVASPQPTPVVVAPAPQPVICQTGERRCRDQGTVETCEDGAWVPTDCHQYCQDHHGVGFHSEGCVATAQSQCHCVENYDMVDGGIGYVEPDML